MRRTGALAVLVIICALGIGLPAAGQTAEAPPVPAEATAPPEGPAPGERKPSLYNGTDPDRNLQQYLPEPLSIVRYPQGLDPALRGVSLLPGAIQLIQGGQLVRELPFPGDRQVGFEEVSAAVADPSWIRVVRPGVFELSAAFVQQPGTDLRIAAPLVQEVRLVTNPGVFFGGSGAKARFEGVRVTSWDASLATAATDIENARPFVLYEKGSRLDIVDSNMGYLGSDRTSAYGVSWRQGGTTGEVLRSRFHHSFFGVYTYEAKDIVFRHNVFSDNIYYGFDPHDYTTGLVVEENEAYGNGSHGFIVSRYVTDSVLARNHSHDNGGNGIVLDFHSDGNRVLENRVQRNAKDGIVLNQSSRNLVQGNVISSNRVGIRSSHTNTANRIERNHLDGNVTGVQLDAATTDTVVSGNEVLGSTAAGMILDAPRSSVSGGRITDAALGLDLRAAVTISDVQVTGVVNGVRVRPGGVADLRRLDVDAAGVGVQIETGARASLADSVVRAWDPLEGESLLQTGSTLVAEGRRPLPWQPVAAVSFILLAVGLEFLRARRDPDIRPVTPQGVWNTA